MKLRLAALICVLILPLSLVSCSQKTKEFSLSPFECYISVESETVTLEGRLSYSLPSDVRFTVTSPDDINGVSVFCEGGIIRISSGDVVFNLDEISSEYDLFTPLFNFLHLLSTAETEVNYEGTDVLTLCDESGEYNAEISCDEMRLLSLKSKGITYKFIYN